MSDEIKNWQYFLDKQVGKRYIFGSENSLTDKEALLNSSSWDCSEIVQGAFYYAADIKIVDGSYNQFNASSPVQGRPLKPGDLGFLRNKRGTIHHVCCYYGNGYEVEARGKLYGVQKRPASVFESSREFAGWRRPNGVDVWEEYNTVKMRFSPRGKTFTFVNAVRKTFMDLADPPVKNPPSFLIEDGYLVCYVDIRYEQALRKAILAWRGKIVGRSYYA